MTIGRLVVCFREAHSWGRDSWVNVPGIRVSIADTGSGMTVDVQQRIFEAFFTTKEATGTGLGLWVSHGIVEKHHGTIRVRSSVAKHPGGSSGTVFTVFFPHDAVRPNDSLNQSHAAGTP